MGEYELSRRNRGRKRGEEEILGVGESGGKV